MDAVPSFYQVEAACKVRWPQFGRMFKIDADRARTECLAWWPAIYQAHYGTQPAPPAIWQPFGPTQTP